EHHETFVRENGTVKALPLCGIHPEAAERIGFSRFAGFELERIAAAEGVYCFFGKSREIPEDERMFVLGDVRGRPTEEGREAGLYIPLFEGAFHEATRTMRLNLSSRDPRRRLQWNRLVVTLAHPIYLEPMQ